MFQQAVSLLFLFAVILRFFKHQPVQYPYSPIAEKIAQNRRYYGKQNRNEIDCFHIIRFGIKNCDRIYEVEIKITGKFLHIKAAGYKQQNRQYNARNLRYGRRVKSLEFIVFYSVEQNQIVVPLPCSPGLNIDKQNIENKTKDKDYKLYGVFRYYYSNRLQVYYKQSEHKHYRHIQDMNEKYFKSKAADSAFP